MASFDGARIGCGGIIAGEHRRRRDCDAYLRPQSAPDVSRRKEKPVPSATILAVACSRDARPLVPALGGDASGCKKRPVLPNSNALNRPSSSPVVTTRLGTVVQRSEAVPVVDDGRAALCRPRFPSSKKLRKRLHNDPTLLVIAASDSFVSHSWRRDHDKSGSKAVYVHGQEHVTAMPRSNSPCPKAAFHDGKFRHNRQSSERISTRTGTTAHECRKSGAQDDGNLPSSSLFGSCPSKPAMRKPARASSLTCLSRPQRSSASIPLAALGVPSGVCERSSSQGRSGYDARVCRSLRTSPRISQFAELSFVYGSPKPWGRGGSSRTASWQGAGSDGSGGDRGIRSRRRSGGAYAAGGFDDGGHEEVDGCGEACIGFSEERVGGICGGGGGGGTGGVGRKGGGALGLGRVGNAEGTGNGDAGRGGGAGGGGHGRGGNGGVGEGETHAGEKGLAGKGGVEGGCGDGDAGGGGGVSGRGEYGGACVGSAIAGDAESRGSSPGSGKNFHSRVGLQARNASLEKCLQKNARKYRDELSRRAEYRRSSRRELRSRRSLVCRDGFQFSPGYDYHRWPPQPAEADANESIIPQSAAVRAVLSLTNTQHVSSVDGATQLVLDCAEEVLEAAREDAVAIDVGNSCQDEAVCSTCEGEQQEDKNPVVPSEGYDAAESDDDDDVSSVKSDEDIPTTESDDPSAGDGVAPADGTDIFCRKPSLRMVPGWQQSESLARDVFGRFGNLGELGRDQLVTSLRFMGFAQVDKELIDDIMGKHFQDRSFLDKAEFLDLHSMYTVRYQEQMLEKFRQVDTGKSGVIGTAQFSSFLRQEGFMPMPGMISELFREVTGDGGRFAKMNFEVFLQASEIVQKRAGFSRTEHEELTAVFSRFDFDGNGTLDGKEIRTALSWLGFSADTAFVDSLLLALSEDECCALSLEGFMIFMRRCKEYEVERIQNAFGNQDRNFSGSIVPDQLPGFFWEVGYFAASPEVIMEALETASAAVGTKELLFEDLFVLFQRYRDSNGFSREELDELVQTFKHVSRGTDTIDYLDVIAGIRWLGYPAARNQYLIQDLMEDLDVGHTGDLELTGFIKLMARFREREIALLRDEIRDGSAAHAVVQGNLTGSDVLNAMCTLGYQPTDEQCSKILQEFGESEPCVGLWEAARLLKEQRFADRDSIRQYEGFTEGDVRRFRARFSRHDPKSTGVVNSKHVAGLLLDLFPDAKKSKRAHSIMKSTYEEASVSSTFTEFLAMLRKVYDVSLRQRYEAEQQSITKTQFSLEEVREFRSIFANFDTTNSRDIDSWDLQKMISGLFPNWDEARLKDELPQLLQGFVFDRPQSVDFGEFLHVMKKMISTNWNGIVSVTAEMARESHRRCSATRC
eukprot:TRINITY_DN12773_c0_g2_i1.p1 TRINITY_DN12773_c0_g2~~TRINITY_DN12773_c0_g2_i1.p1  ORF type:complete len:1459 (-),score=189.46 TRINITY_DN12773_c0_g2_i1:590-4687(-)